MFGGEEIVSEGFVEKGWSWVRQDNDGIVHMPQLPTEELRLKPLPGGIWGDVFAAKPARNFLLRPQTDFNAVQVTVTMNPKTWGEQAGLFWLVDDDNYAKLVVEGMKDGSTCIVMAVEIQGSPKVLAKVPWTPDKSVTLRLERSPQGTLTGSIVSYCIRLVARCDVSSFQRTVRVGVAAHGGEAQSSTVASLSEWQCLRVAEDRIQLGEKARQADEQSAAQQETEVQAQETTVAPAGAIMGPGWDNMPAARREQLLATLAARGHSLSATAQASTEEQTETHTEPTEEQQSVAGHVAVEPPSQGAFEDGEQLLFEGMRDLVEGRSVWLRQDRPHWMLVQDTLTITAQADNPPQNVCLCIVPPECNAIQMTVSLGGGDAPCVAGLAWFQDDDNYVQVCMDRRPDGTFVAMDVKKQGIRELVSEVPCELAEVTLRLERSQSGRVTACLVSCFTQLVGAYTVPWPTVRPALMVQSGGQAQASFTAFQALQLAPDRLQLADEERNGDVADTNGTPAPIYVAGQSQSQTQVCNAPSGWIVSSKMSPEKRAQVFALLGQTPQEGTSDKAEHSLTTPLATKLVPEPIPASSGVAFSPPEQLPTGIVRRDGVWVCADLSESEQQKVTAMLGGVQQRGEGGAPQATVVGKLAQQKHQSPERPPQPRAMRQAQGWTSNMWWLVGVAGLAFALGRLSR